MFASAIATAAGDVAAAVIAAAAAVAGKRQRRLLFELQHPDNNMSSHPAHDLFEPIPSCRRFRSIKTRTNRFSTSFFPLAVQALSKQK